MLANVDIAGYRTRRKSVATVKQLISKAALKTRELRIPKKAGFTTVSQSLAVGQGPKCPEI